MATYNIDSEGHNREFELSYSSDEPTLGGGSIKPLICNGTFDIELSELTLDKTAGEVYSALRAGRLVIVTQTISGSAVESMPIIAASIEYVNDVETGTSIPKYSFYVLADLNSKFVCEDLRTDDPVVLALVTASEP